MKKNINQNEDDTSNKYRFWVIYNTYGLWGWDGEIIREGNHSLYGLDDEFGYDIFEKRSELISLVKFFKKVIKNLVIDESVEQMDLEIESQIIMNSKKEALKRYVKNSFEWLCDELEKFKVSDDLTFNRIVEEDDLCFVSIYIEHLSIE